METDNQEEKKLVISEEQDGSVTINGFDPSDRPDLGDKDAAPAEKEEESPQGGADGGEISADDDQDRADDTEAIRSARRERRKLKKQMHKQAQVEKDLRYNQLLRDNQDLRNRLSAVEQRTHGSELARLDKAIEDQQVRVQYAKMKISEATQAQDGEAMSDAQDLLYEARRSLESLQNLKKQSSQPRQQAITPPDPMVQRRATNWMEKNSWYDPAGEDEDSQIAMMIDKRLTKEGFDPRSEEYWEELDSRLQDRLPHRYISDKEEKSIKRPRSVVTGSGRENAATGGGSNSFRLTADQVSAMKEAGMWDDPVLREKMIRRYRQDSLNRRG